MKNKSLSNRTILWTEGYLLSHKLKISNPIIRIPAWFLKDNPFIKTNPKRKVDITISHNSKKPMELIITKMVDGIK